MFGSLPLKDICGLLRTYGFSGIEIAPYTISDENGHIPAKTLATIGSVLGAEGIAFAGFHWLFVHPDGLSVTSADPIVQRRTIDHLKELLDAAARLGGGNLIFGSPNQRSVCDAAPSEGRLRLEQFLGNVADYAQDAGCIICLEALPKKDTNVLNTLEEVDQVVRHLDHPAVQGMFDFHNCVDETLGWEQLVRRYAAIMCHVHINRMDGGHPVPSLAGEYLAAFEQLRAQRYERWISLEIFSMPQDPKMVLQETKEFLDIVWAE